MEDVWLPETGPWTTIPLLPPARMKEFEPLSMVPVRVRAPLPLFLMVSDPLPEMVIVLAKVPLVAFPVKLRVPEEVSATPSSTDSSVPRDCVAFACVAPTPKERVPSRTKVTPE